MPNSIKYSTTGDTQSLRDGNFYIGTGDVGKGPTSSSGHWNGITPPGGGYTVYKNKVSNGPAIWTATSDNQLISLTNNTEGTSFTTIQPCLNYYATQTDKMVFNKDYEGIVTSGLTVCLDAGFLPSYQGSGATWYDLAYSGNNGNLINGATFVSSDGGSIVFDGTDDYASFTYPNNLIMPTFTVCSVITPIAVAGNGTVVFTNESARLNLGIAYGGNNGGYFFVAGNNGQSINGVFGSYGFSYGTNTKYFVTWIVDIPGKNFQFWVNGTLVGSSTADLGTNFSNTSANGFVLASRYGGGSSRVNIGISNFQFYNRVLTSYEIINNYNAGLARFNTQNVVKTNLLLNLDSTNSVSYPTTGTVWRDLSGYGNHATGIGSPTFDSTTKSFQFDATDDRFSSTISRPFDMYCLEITFKPHKQISSNVAPDNNAYSLLGVRRSIGNNNGINVYEWTGGMTDETVTFWSHDGYATGIVDTVTNEFHTMTFNWNGSTYDIWLDGVKRSTIARTTGHAQLLTNVTFVDPGYSLGYSYYHKGNISTVRAYNRILSSQEILQNYYQAPIVTSGLLMALDAGNLVSYSGAGTTWKDLTSNGNNSTLTNGPTYSSTNGGSIVFDGSDDYLITPTITNFRTISLWIKTSNTGGGWRYLIDARPGMSNGWYTGFESGGGVGGGWSSQYVNGVPTTVSFSNITLGTWCNLVVISNAAYTSTINFMSRFSNAEMLNGSIGNIMIYNRVLSADEVAQNYNAQKSRFGL